MGSVFGGHLALAGHDVTLVDVWREHMDAVAADGLDLRTPEGTSVIVHMRAIHDPSLLEPVELVIVLTKTFAGAVRSSSAQPTCCSRPPAMTPTRSAIANASLWSCVT